MCSNIKTCALYTEIAVVILSDFQNERLTAWNGFSLNAFLYQDFYVTMLSVSKNSRVYPFQHLYWLINTLRTGDANLRF